MGGYLRGSAINGIVIGIAEFIGLLIIGVPYALTIVLQQAEGQILVPLIMRAQAQISPLLAIFSIVASASIGGLLGAVIAIPIASLLSVLIRMVIAPAIRRAKGVKAEEV